MGKRSKKLQEGFWERAGLRVGAGERRTERRLASLRRALALTFGQQRGRETLSPRVRVRRQRSQGWSRVTAHA